MQQVVETKNSINVTLILIAFYRCTNVQRVFTPLSTLRVNRIFKSQ